MKIRTGLVSNSSSSSFCIIQLGSRDHYKVLRALGYSRDDESYWDNYEGYGCYKGDKVIQVYGGDEPDHVGLDLEPMLKEGLTLGEMKERLREHCLKEYGAEVSVKQMRLEYGEAGNG